MNLEESIYLSHRLKNFMYANEEIDELYSIKYLQKKIKQAPKWWHTIQLGTKFKTPGTYDKKMWNYISNLLPKDFSGKTVLDVGTRDGDLHLNVKGEMPKRY